MAHNNAYQTTITFVVIMFLVLSGVSLRILVRKITKQPLALDDWLIIASAAFAIGFAIVFPFSNLFGNGRHIYLLRPDQISNYLRTLRYITHVLEAVSIAWLLTAAFLTAFQCDPVRKAWMPEIPGTCVNSFSIIFIGIQVPNIVLDLVIITLLVRQVSRLQMRPSRKYSVITVFLLGSFGVIASILRLAFTITRIGAEDVTHNTEIANWTLIETGIQLFSACLPTLYPLARIRINWDNLRSRLSLSRRSNIASDPEEGTKRSAVFSLKGQSHDQKKEEEHQTPEDSHTNGKVHSGKSRTWGPKSSRKERDGDAMTDTVPLRDIQVTHDIEQRTSASSRGFYAQ